MFHTGIYGHLEGSEWHRIRKIPSLSPGPGNDMENTLKGEGANRVTEGTEGTEGKEGTEGRER